MKLRLGLRDLEQVVVVAAALVLVSSLWRRMSATPDVRPLSPAQAKAIRERPGRALVFPGNYRDTVVFFLDYRCPYCAIMYQDFVRAETRYGFSIAYAVGSRNSPAAQAAIAAECARRQSRFHALNYALFARRDSVGLLSWRAFGAAAGVPDLEHFSDCIENRIPIDVIDDDIWLGKLLNVSGTPAAVHAGRLYMGPVAVGEKLKSLNIGRE